MRHEAGAACMQEEGAAAGRGTHEGVRVVSQAAVSSDREGFPVHSPLPRRATRRLDTGATSMGAASKGATRRTRRPAKA